MVHGVRCSVLQGLTIQTAGGLAILKWTRSGDADVRIGGNVVIRHSSALVPTWQTSRSMDRVNGNEAMTVVPLIPGTCLPRAEDSGGRQGPIASVSSKGAQVVPFAPVDLLQADPGFSGTLTDVVAAGGTLFLAGNALVDDWATVDAIDNVDFNGGVRLEGTFRFGTGMDFGTVRRMRLRADIIVQSVPVFDLFDARVGNINAWDDIDAADGSEVDVVMEMRETDDDPAASPAWSAWARVDSTEIQARGIQARGIQARAILSTTDAAFTPVVTRLRLNADEAI